MREASASDSALTQKAEEDVQDDGPCEAGKAVENHENDGGCDDNVADKVLVKVEVLEFQ